MVADRRAVLRVHSKEYLNFVQDLASSIECPEPFTPKVQKQLRSDPEHLVCVLICVCVCMRVYAYFPNMIRLLRSLVLRVCWGEQACVMWHDALGLSAKRCRHTVRPSSVGISPMLSAVISINATHPLHSHLR